MPLIQSSKAAPCALLVVLSIAFRWPALINASTVNSDAAIVALQGMHILRGELSPLLFGSGYQTSVDSFVAALFFTLLGPTPLALMVSTLSGHIAATLLAFATLARHLPRWTATIAVMPLVFTPSPLHTYILGPPRQAALTLVFLAVWLVDRSDAGASLRSKARMAAAGVTASLACFADPYALLFLPPFFLLALVLALPPCAMETSRWATTFRTVRPTLAGAVVGIVPLLLLLASPRSVHGEATFTPSVIGHNAKLLYDECLPWVMSSTAFVPGDAGYVAWNPGAFRAIQLAGPFLVFSAVAFALSSPPRPVSEAGGERHFWALGLYGVAVLALDVAAFLASPMVMDVFSARYLAAIVLMMPFALAPAASRLKPAVFTALMAPYLVSAGVCGWVGFGGQVRGLSPVRLPGGGALDEERLQALLRDHSVGHAVADYWVSYRLTFLYRETIEVVPIHPEEDRYAPYRRAFDQSSNVAYVFDARRSREQLGPMLEDLETKYGAPEETLVSGDLKAFVFERAVTP